MTGFVVLYCYPLPRDCIAWHGHFYDLIRLRLTFVKPRERIRAGAGVRLACLSALIRS
jgi:hypothetical protein